MTEVWETPEERRELKRLSDEGYKWKNPYYFERIAEYYERCIEEGRVTPESLDRTLDRIERAREFASAIKDAVREKWGYEYDDRCRWFRDPVTGRMAKIPREEYFRD